MVSKRRWQVLTGDEATLTFPGWFSADPSPRPFTHRGGDLQHDSVAEFQSRPVGIPRPAQPWPWASPCALLTPVRGQPCPDAPGGGYVASAVVAPQMVLSLERVALSAAVTLCYPA